MLSLIVVLWYHVLSYLSSSFFKFFQVCANCTNSIDLFCAIWFLLIFWYRSQQIRICNVLRSVSVVVPMIPKHKTKFNKQTVNKLWTIYEQICLCCMISDLNLCAFCIIFVVMLKNDDILVIIFSLFITILLLILWYIFIFCNYLLLFVIVL